MNSAIEDLVLDDFSYLLDNRLSNDSIPSSVTKKLSEKSVSLKEQEISKDIVNVNNNPETNVQINLQNQQQLSPNDQVQPIILQPVKTSNTAFYIIAIALVIALTAGIYLIYVSISNPEVKKPAINKMPQYKIPIKEPVVNNDYYELSDYEIDNQSLSTIAEEFDNQEVSENEN